MIGHKARWCFNVPPVKRIEGLGYLITQLIILHLAVDRSRINHQAADIVTKKPEEHSHDCLPALHNFS